MRGVIATAPRTEPGLMAQWAKTLMLTGGHPAMALELANQMKAHPRVIEATKSSIGAHWTGDPDVPGVLDVSYITTTFLPFLRTASLFYTALDMGMARIPLQQRVSLISASATAFIRAEGAAIPVSRMKIEAGGVERRGAHAIVVMTKELLNSAGSTGEAMISRELRRAIAPTVDAEFFEIVTENITPISSSGAGGLAAVADIQKLIAAVEPTSESRLLIGMAADVARDGSTLTWPVGGFVFPELRPTGGSILGVDVVVSSALPAGTITLIDTTGLAGDAELISLEASDDTTVAMSTDPDNEAPEDLEMVSMFQTRSVALKASAYFGVQRFRDNAVALIEGVEWADEGSF